MDSNATHHRLTSAATRPFCSTSWKALNKIYHCASIKYSAYASEFWTGRLKACKSYVYHGENICTMRCPEFWTQRLKRLRRKQIFL